MKQPLLTLLCICLSYSIACSQQVTPPTVQACGTSQEFCLTDEIFDLCVRITVNPGLPADIDHFEINWGDDSPVTIVPGSMNPANQNHEYDLSGFYQTCTFEDEYFVELETFLTNGSELNSSFKVTFKNPPTAAIEINPAIICLGQEACFENDSCPTEELTVVSWNYGDGTSGDSNCHTYSEVGIYTVTLNVENPCGMASTTATIEVINSAMAEATATSGVVDASADTLVVCLGGGGGEVGLDGISLSENENNYLWNALTNSINYDWIVDPPSQSNPTIGDPTIVFFNAGIYQVVLTVNNNCNQPDSDTLIFRVLDADALLLNSQADACLNLSYAPVPLNPLATYTVNGNQIPIADFPISLGIGLYEVEARLGNECGEQLEVDNFAVTEQEMVSILFPTSDTILCVGTEPVLLDYAPIGGDWSGSANIIIVGDSVWYNPQMVETVTLVYGRGVGACRGTESILIEVVGVEITANDYQKCSWSEDFKLEASPAGGSWSSTDCPSCIVNDTFSISNMQLLGLTSVEVNYEVTSSSSDCEGMTNITVTIENPLASFTVSDTICEDESLVISTLGTLADVIQWRLDGVNNSGPPFSDLSSGDHSLELIAVNGECRDSLTRQFVVAAAPGLIDFIASTTSGCADLEVGLQNISQGESLAFEWLLDGVVFSTLADPGSLVLEQGLTDTTYTISLIVANGCGGDSSSQTILVNPKPIANFGTDQLEYCSGDTVKFANVTRGNPDSVRWDFGNGLTSTNVNPPNLIYFTDTIPTIYPVRLIAFNGCGTDTITKNIIINPTDVEAFFSTNPLSGCAGQSICLESFSTLGANILFDFGEGNTSTNQMPCHVYQNPGNYTIILKAFGCGFDSISKDITIFPAPELSIITNEIGCPGQEILFEAVTSDVVEFEWNFGDGQNSVLTSPAHYFDTAGTYLVKLTGTSINGCTYEDSIQVTVATSPLAQFTISNDSICSGDSIFFINTTGANILSCFWDFGDGNFSNDCAPNHIYEGEGSFTARLIVTNTNGCSDTINQLINVYAEPIPIFDFSLDQECTPVAVTINNLSTNATSYLWDFGNGEISNLTNPIATYSVGDIYPIQLTAINGVCARTTSLPITIRQTPQLLTALSDPEGCAPFSINFEAIAEGEDLSYNWNFGNGISAFGEIADHRFTDPGLYTVTLLVESPFCQDSLIEQVEIFEPVEVDIATVDILCNSAATGAIDLNIVGGTAPFEFDWSNESDGEDPVDLLAGDYTVSILDANDCFLMDSITLVEPLPITTSVGDSSVVSCFGGDDGGICIEVSGGVSDYMITWENQITGNCLDDVSAGNYDVTIVDGNNCIVENAFNIRENPQIKIIDTLANISCFGADDGYILLDSITGGVDDFYNTTLNGPVFYDGGMSFPNLTPGAYQLTVQDLEGCTLEKDFIIREPDSLWLEIPEDSLFIGLGDSVRIQTDHNADILTLLWAPGLGLNCINCEDPYAAPHKTTTYHLLLTDQSGCTLRDTTTVIVDLNRNFYIPNTFTPNGDGRNDVFRIRSRLPSIEKVIVFRIFDRWGEMVFETTDYKPQDESSENAWDGTFKGKLLTPDVFTFYAEILYLDKETELVEGTVTLIR